MVGKWKDQCEVQKIIDVIKHFYNEICASEKQFIAIQLLLISEMSGWG